MKITEEFEQFKGFILTLLGQKQFVMMFKKPDKSTILNFLISKKYFSPDKLKELITLYTDTDYNAFIATIAHGEIIKTIAAKSDEIIKSLKNATPEEIEFNAMLYNLDFFDSKLLQDVKTEVNKYVK